MRQASSRGERGLAGLSHPSDWLMLSVAAWLGIADVQSFAGHRLQLHGTPQSVSTHAHCLWRCSAEPMHARCCPAIEGTSVFVAGSHASCCGKSASVQILWLVCSWSCYHEPPEVLCWLLVRKTASGYLHAALRPRCCCWQACVLCCAVCTVVLCERLFILAAPVVVGWAPATLGGVPCACVCKHGCPWHRCGRCTPGQLRASGFDRGAASGQELGCWVGQAGAA